MTVLYQNKEIAVRKHFFSNKISCVAFASGKSVVATDAEMSRTVLYLDCAKTAQLTANEREFAVSYIFERFAGAVLERNSIGAEMFMTANPKAFLDALDTTILVMRGEPPSPFD